MRGDTQASLRVPKKGSPLRADWGKGRQENGKGRTEWKGKKKAMRDVGGGRGGRDGRKGMEEWEEERFFSVKAQCTSSFIPIFLVSDDGKEKKKGGHNLAHFVRASSIPLFFFLLLFPPSLSSSSSFTSFLLFWCLGW